MLSRVADTIYWLARYLERSQAMLQVLRINYIASQDEQAFEGWRPLLYTYGDLTEEEITATVGDTAQVLGHLIFDRDNAVSVYNNIVQGRENARAVQDHITKEVWLSLNDYYHAIRQEDVARLVQVEDPVSGIDFLFKQGLLFAGTVQHTMPRDEGYVFLSMGKYLERALQTADIMRLKQEAFAPNTEPHHSAAGLRYLLYALFGYELYTKTYKGVITPENVLEMLVYDEDFPHSLAYSLGQLQRYCERLRDQSLPESYDHLHFLIGKAKNNVAYSSFQARNGPALAQFLQQTRSELFEVAGALNTHYFGNS
ncbi:alpha-E domain-containing protein [Hymenobacter negativus]|uniref:Alpha-E domain-containing protein n=1 Tax=Hymenobacter negativus TaxID=2795026 RepID=A0ABS3QMD9_9BACT|nr:alpha-E domain-containing protein [Hymenobacter negativus]MBO2012416.1 alpha-E domain-containing protein [Hymenobacter negativus]